MAELSYLTVSLFHHAGERSALLLNLSHAACLAQITSSCAARTSLEQPMCRSPCVATERLCAPRPSTSQQPTCPTPDDGLRCTGVLRIMSENAARNATRSRRGSFDREGGSRSQGARPTSCTGTGSRCGGVRAGAVHAACGWSPQVGGSDHGNLPHQEGDRNRSGRCQRGPRGEGQREVSARQRAE